MEPDIKLELTNKIIDAMEDAIAQGLDEDCVLGILDKIKQGIHYPHFSQAIQNESQPGTN